MKAQKLNQRQARWTLYLSRFDFILKHILGTRIGKADGLSRRSDWKVGIEKDNKDQVLIKDNWIHSLQEVVILEKIKKAKSKNEDVVRIVEEMKRAKVKELQGEKWQIEGELVLKEGKIYVLKNEELRAEVI